MYGRLERKKQSRSLHETKHDANKKFDFVYDKQFIILMRCIVTIMPCTSVTLVLVSLNSINKCTRHIHKSVRRCTMYYMRYIYQFICGRIFRSCQKLKPLIFDDCCCRWDAQIKCKMHIAFPWHVFMPLSFGTYGFFSCGLFRRSHPFYVLLRTVRTKFLHGAYMWVRVYVHLISTTWMNETKAVWNWSGCIKTSTPNSSSQKFNFRQRSAQHFQLVKILRYRDSMHPLCIPFCLTQFFNFQFNFCVYQSNLLSWKR